MRGRIGLASVFTGLLGTFVLWEGASFLVRLGPASVPLWLRILFILALAGPMLVGWWLGALGFEIGASPVKTAEPSGVAEAPPADEEVFSRRRMAASELLVAAVSILGVVALVLLLDRHVEPTWLRLGFAGWIGLRARDRLRAWLHDGWEAPEDDRDEDWQ